MTQEFTLTPRIVKRESQRIIGIGGGFGKHNSSQIGMLWMELHKRKPDLKMEEPSEYYGVCMDSHPDIRRNKGDVAVYIAGVPASPSQTVPPSMVSCELPYGEYAAFMFKGSVMQIPEFVGQIFTDWIPSSHYNAIQGAPFFELYGCGKFDIETSTGEIEIFIPIQPK